MKNNIKNQIDKLQKYFIDKLLNDQAVVLKIDKYQQGMYIISFEIDNQYPFLFLYQDKLNFLSQQLSFMLLKLTDEQLLELKRIVKQKLVEYLKKTMLNINLNTKKNDTPNT